MSSDTEVDCEYRAESATYIPKPGEIVVRVCADNGLALCIVVTEHDGSEENLREMNAALRSTANDTFTSMSTKKSNTYYRTEENEVGVVSADGKHIAPWTARRGATG